MYSKRFEKEAFKEEVKNNIKNLYRKTIEEATGRQIFQAVSLAVKETIIDYWLATQAEMEKEDPKTVYYMSMEFLMGRALGNNLINMTAYKEVKEALDEMGYDYIINEGDGAFYGPKIDFHLEDSLGRTWQCGTIQLDFQLPLRFEAEYTGADGEKHRPIMIHRVLLGSIERFIGILIEHYAGKFPAWLAPVQVKVLPISDKNAAYAKDVYNTLKKNHIRCEIDERPEKIGYKIREAQLEKVPYMLVAGAKEEENHTVAVRYRDSGENVTMSVEDFAEMLKKEIEERK